MRSLIVQIFVVWNMLSGYVLADVTNNPFIGSWSYKVDDDCAALHVSGSDGSLLARSNNELLTRSFSIISSDVKNRVYKVKIENLHDNGEADCLGSTENYAGSIYLVYVVFDDSYQSFYFHLTLEQNDSRLGPYVRVD